MFVHNSSLASVFNNSICNNRNSSSSSLQQIQRQPIGLVQLQVARLALAVLIFVLRRTRLDVFAFDDQFHFGRVERLVLEQRLGQQLELALVSGQNFLDTIVRFLLTMMKMKRVN